MAVPVRLSLFGSTTGRFLVCQTESLRNSGLSDEKVQQCYKNTPSKYSLLWKAMKVFYWKPFNSVKGGKRKRAACILFSVCERQTLSSSSAKLVLKFTAFASCARSFSDASTLKSFSNVYRALYSTVCVLCTQTYERIRKRLAWWWGSQTILKNDNFSSCNLHFFLKCRCWCHPPKTVPIVRSTDFGAICLSCLIVLQILTSLDRRQALELDFKSRQDCSVDSKLKSLVD